MAYSLSFSPEFFYNEGEPYDCSLEHDGLRSGKVKPTSVYQALCAMSDEDACAAMEACTGKPWPRRLGPPAAEYFMEYIEATDTCTDLSSPVEVWIDPDGRYRIKVY